MNSRVKVNSLKKLKYGYLMHTLPVIAFDTTVVNRALLSLHGGSLDIALTVPLIFIFTSLYYCYYPSVSVYFLQDYPQKTT